MIDTDADLANAKSYIQSNMSYEDDAERQDATSSIGIIIFCTTIKIVVLYP